MDNPFALVVGVDSGANKETSLEALGAAAAAFVSADAAARPANQLPVPSPDPIAAANTALQDNKRKEDLDGDKIVQQP
jgi:hypothetical protein